MQVVRITVAIMVMMMTVVRIIMILKFNFD